MREASTSTDIFDDPSAGRVGLVKWILPVILLVLVVILVAVAAFSRQAPSVWSVTDIVLFVLTALLCTLVAASLALTGCGRWLTRIEQSIQPMTADIIAIQDTQAGLCEALQESNARTVLEEKSQRLLQDSFGRLADNVQTVVSNVAGLGQALQARSEATTTAIAALAASQGQLTNDVRRLQELTQTVAGGITDAAREQAAVRGILRDSAQAGTAATEAIHQGQSTLQTTLEGIAETGRQTIAAVTAMAAEQKTAQETTRHMMEEVTGVETRQSGLGETLRAHGDVINMAIASLAASQGQLTNDVRRVQELTQTVAGGITDAAHEQATAHNSLQQVLTASTEAIHQGQSTLQTKLEDIAGTGRQTIAAITAMAAEQTSVHETAKHVMEAVAGVGTRQTALGEALQAHREGTNAGIAAMTSGQGQLTNDIRQLHGLTQTVAGNITDAARDQAAGHSSLQQALTGTTEAIHQGQNALQAKLEDMAGTGRQTMAAVTAMAAEQTAVHETARHVMEQVTGVGSRQTALGEALQTHGEATNTGIAALTSGQGQLTDDVRQLHELTRTVAGGVTDAAREQAAAHAALRDSARALTAAIDAIQQIQQALQIEIEKIAETAKQTMGAVSAVAVEQTTGREATKHVIGELANAAIAALDAGYRPLPRDDRRLQALVQTVAGGGPLNIELPAPAEEADTSPRLPAARAIIHGGQMKYEVGPDRDNLGCWGNASDWAEWELDVTRPGRFKVTAEIAALDSGRFQVILGDQGLDGNAPSTGDYGRFQKVEIGTVELAAAGKTSLAVRPIPEGWQPMNLKSVELVPLT